MTEHISWRSLVQLEVVFHHPDARRVRVISQRAKARGWIAVLPQRARRVGFFPGSTIGNFHPTEALESLAPQTVQVAGERFTIAEGETIWTESSTIESLSRQGNNRKHVSRDVRPMS